MIEMVPSDGIVACSSGCFEPLGKCLDIAIEAPLGLCLQLGIGVGHERIFRLEIGYKQLPRPQAENARYGVQVIDRRANLGTGNAAYRALAYPCGISNILMPPDSAVVTPAFVMRGQ